MPGATDVAADDPIAAERSPRIPVALFQVRPIGEVDAIGLDSPRQLEVVEDEGRDAAFLSSGNHTRDIIPGPARWIDEHGFDAIHVQHRNLFQVCRNDGEKMRGLATARHEAFHSRNRQPKEPEQGRAPLFEPASAALPSAIWSDWGQIVALGDRCFALEIWPSTLGGEQSASRIRHD
jgi:hypothetical protein